MQHMERKTVNLSGADLEGLAPYLEHGSAAQRWLAAAVGEPETPYLSDSSALRALALLGKKAIDDARLSDGYHRLADSYVDEDDGFAAEAVDAAERAWTDEAGP